MDIEAKERLRHIAERLLGTSYMRACDFTASEEEFQETVNALVHHLMKVRKRAQELNMEKLTV